jgi:zinc protease
MDSTITRLTLSNGLLVALKEIHTAPIISHWVWYRVGSRDESPPTTGLSHWVEHMLFKGTPRFPAGVLDKAISRNGGAWNAFTYLDWTAYFETLPTDKIDLALQLEADRMQNCLFDPEEVETERTVIISEREEDENEPTFRLSEAVQAAAFKHHPYGHEVIGFMGDLETIQRDDLYRHYRSHYCPNNAVLTIAGDFDTATMLARVQELFEPLPPGEVIHNALPVEPALGDQVFIQMSGPGETTYLQSAYPVPAARQADFSALVVLDSLLSGPSDLSIFGAGLTNKTSRLYRALVEKELAISAFGGLQATIDPYLLNLSIIVHPGSSYQAVVAALDQEIERFQQAPPGQGELERAVKQARALFAYSSESITNQAAWLGFVEMFADPDWLANYLENLARVSPADVQRVAQTYLDARNRIIGVYLPLAGAG